MEGQFIVLEGIDGSGTTTQMNLLGDWYRGQGLPALMTAEPSDGPVGAMIRMVLTRRLVVQGMSGPRAPSWPTMTLLFAADRLDHLESSILPNLYDGVTVISDRYDLSSLAYQAASAEAEFGDKGVIDWVREVNARARRPDLTIVLDVSADVAAKRRQLRDVTSELYEGTELQRTLADIYREAQALVPGDRLVHVDGAQSVEAVHQDIVKAVQTFRGGA